MKNSFVVSAILILFHSKPYPFSHINIIKIEALTSVKVSFSVCIRDSSSRLYGILWDETVGFTEQIECKKSVSLVVSI